MNTKKLNLIEAEEKAIVLFQTIEKQQIIQTGKSEKEINDDIYKLAFALFGIKKYWHKRIVRAGKNTLLPYAENPPNVIVQKEDIVFLDFGPVFENWEADFGRTFVVGKNETMLQLQKDVELAWQEGYNYYTKNKNTITGAAFYAYTQQLAVQYGWQYGNEHCGHLVGNFPHEKLLGEEKQNYIHPENKVKMSDVDKLGNERFWIYEIHFIDPVLQIGAFYEQLMR